MAGAVVRTNPNRKNTTSTGGGSSKKTYNEKEDYQALINEAVKNNDYSSAAKYEQLRNQKIIGEGLNTPTTSNYISHLNGWDTGGTNSGGTNLGSTTSGNSQYTGTNLGKVYDVNADYQAYINDAVARGDFKSAAMYEQLRNQKIIGEGLDYATTNLYGSYLEDQTPQQNQQDSLSAILEYMQNWQQQNQKPTEPESDPRIDEMLSQILNRDAFSYNVENDPLYQQYLQTAQREGDRAMRETLAEAATSAGGMNSYAITAAQQANNYYNSQLNDRIPELYQLAYDKYLKDIDNQVRDLGLLQSMDETQYNRYRNTMNDWQNDKTFAYGMYNDAVQQGNWQTTQDYNSMWDNINYYTNNSRYNQEWNANQSQLDLENSRYDTENWEKQMLAVIEAGKMPSDEIIQKAGWDKSVVEILVQQAIADQNKPSGTRRKVDDDLGGGDEKTTWTSKDNTTTVDLSDFDDSKIPATMIHLDNLETGSERYSQALSICKEVLAKDGKSAVLSMLKEWREAGDIDQTTYTVLHNKFRG